MKKKLTQAEQMERNWQEASRKRETALLHLAELLRPHSLTDPLVPDICAEIASAAEDQCLPHVSLAFSQLGYASASHHLGAKHASTVELKHMVTDFTSIVGRLRAGAAGKN